MKDKLISVIIPVYNNPDITRAVDSILKQENYSSFEIVIVNDGSKDNTAEIIENYIVYNNLNMVKLITQSNKGPAAARNNGILNSKGEYIAFLDSDDCWEVDKIKKQIKVFQDNPNIKLVCTSLNNIVHKAFPNLQEISFNKLLYRNYIFTSTVIVEKSALFHAGLFNEGQKYSEDYDLWLRFSQKYKCMFINESLVTYGGGKRTFGESGLTSKLWLMEKGELSNYKRLLKNKQIKLLTYISASSFSFLKYLTRVLRTSIYKAQKKFKTAD